ncbi:hypothetical protein CBW24_11570 [Pacificitalea manganoxidans]|uniref:Uncharacterized protein n=1 Tax=Pacificitalea manganoxidans TaxID=1411902 RepID=A0A291M0T6_9RHOB|nr:hypothetical protein CBW24_11570 [Pacificitalea manganoxidans]
MTKTGGAVPGTARLTGNSEARPDLVGARRVIVGFGQPRLLRRGRADGAAQTGAGPNGVSP